MIKDFVWICTEFIAMRSPSTVLELSLIRSKCLPLLSPAPRFYRMLVVADHTDARLLFAFGGYSRSQFVQERILVEIPHYSHQINGLARNFRLVDMFDTVILMYLTYNYLQSTTKYEFKKEQKLLYLF